MRLGGIKHSDLLFKLPFKEKLSGLDINEVYLL